MIRLIRTKEGKNDRYIIKGKKLKKSQFEEFLSSKLGSSSGYGLSNNTETDSLAPNP